MGLIWSLDCKQLRPETPILNNWDLIKFLQFPRISPIPTEGKQNQCCWILNCALRKKLVFNDPIFQYICISQTSCNGSRSFSLSTFTKHKKSKILPIPFPIPRGDNPSSASSWTITHENNYIVANQPQSVYYEGTEQQLNDCIMISKDYYCRQLLQQTPKATTTCLMAIFRSEFHNIHRLCNIEIQQTKEQAIRLNRFQILMYSPKQKIIISCGKETEKEKTIQTIEGLVIISMPHSIPCELISTRFKLKTFPYLEEAFDSTIWS